MYGKVSIIMPNYNCEKFIDETINSVLVQTYSDWELLIVDDCSTDNSCEIISRYCQSDERIKLLINKKNSGAAVSRNKALKEASGEWIAFLDSDDLWLPEKLEKQISFMQNNNYGFSFTKYIEINENSASLHRLISGPKKISKRKMFAYCWIGCLTVMYNRAKVGLIQIENLKKNNDYAMWLKVIKKEKCYLLPEVLAKYRKRVGSISNHGKFSLIKHHYYLFRVGEKMCAVRAMFCTVRNLFNGVWKKIKYVKKVKQL